MPQWRLAPWELRLWIFLEPVPEGEELLQRPAISHDKEQLPTSLPHSILIGEVEVFVAFDVVFIKLREPLQTVDSANRSRKSIDGSGHLQDKNHFRLCASYFIPQFGSAAIKGFLKFSEPWLYPTDLAIMIGDMELGRNESTCDSLRSPRRPNYQ